MSLRWRVVLAFGSFSRHLERIPDERGSALKRGGEVVFIEKGKMPDQDEFEAMISARHTPQVYEKAKRTRVVWRALVGWGQLLRYLLPERGLQPVMNDYVFV